MKQLLFLLLFPCLALAQYQGNGNQKITLGEQTTADGLVWRGIRADTTSKIVPFSDTSAYIILDTVEKTLWLYKAEQVPKWQQVGGSTLDTATMLLPYWRSGRFSGVLPVANGGTGASVRTFVDTINTQTVNGAKTFTSAVTATRFNLNPTPNTATGNGMYLPATNTIGFSTNGTNRMTLDNRGNIGIATTPNTDINTLIKGFQFTQGGSFLARTDIPLLFFGSNIITNQTVAVRQVNGRGARFVVNAANAIGYDFWVETVPYGAAGTSSTSIRKITLEDNGNFGIGDNIEMTQKLDVDGNARIRGLANAANPVNVQVDVNGVLVRTSSIDIKEDVQSLPYGLNEVMLLQPSKFSYIDKYKYGEGYDIGFIAQDVNNVIPEAVGTGIESDIFMDSVKLIPVLTKAIQEQQALIKALEQRIINLENK